MALREPVAAGSFYPKEKEELRQQLQEFFKGLPAQKKTNCIIAPHAGYVYSGRTAAFAFNALQESRCFAILGPNHTGFGPAISISDADEWETPLGRIKVDSALREKLLAGTGIEADDSAHVQEHSIEVQLPFLQFLFKESRILPITLMEHRLPELLKLAKAIASLGENISVIASSDFTHYEPKQAAEKKDGSAIKRIADLDVKGFHEMVLAQNMSICGFAPITALMQYAVEKRLKKGKLLHYDTSATASGDETAVVGYAAIGFY